MLYLLAFGPPSGFPLVQEACHERGVNPCEDPAVVSPRFRCRRAAFLSMEETQRKLLSPDCADAALAALGLLAASGLAQAAPDAQTDGYHRLADVERQLQAWSKAHPELTLVTIGKSQGGRPLWVARIAAGANTSDTPPDERPAIFVGANIGGWQNEGTSRFTCRALIAGARAKNPVRQRTFYIARSSPRRATLSSPLHARSVPAMLKMDHDSDRFEAGPRETDGTASHPLSIRPAGGGSPTRRTELMIKADA